MMARESTGDMLFWLFDRRRPMLGTARRTRPDTRGTTRAMPVRAYEEVDTGMYSIAVVDEVLCASTLLYISTDVLLYNLES